MFESLFILILILFIILGVFKKLDRDKNICVRILGFFIYLILLGNFGVDGVFLWDYIVDLRVLNFENIIYINIKGGIFWK